VKVRTEGAWRDVPNGRIRINNNWRPLTRILVFNEGAWRSSSIFVSPLSLAIAPTSVSGIITAPGTVTTNVASSTPTGGLAPFTYSWVRISGVSASPTSPTNAATSFNFFLDTPGTASAVFRCTVTDALGSTATADVTAIFNYITFD
jgi:hypothetical protein